MWLLVNYADYVTDVGFTHVEIMPVAEHPFYGSWSYQNTGYGSQSAPYEDYNNFWGTAQKNLTYNYFQHEYAVQVFTGTVPKYDEATGEKVRTEGNDYYPYELADKQIICDTLVT